MDDNSLQNTFSLVLISVGLLRDVRDRVSAMYICLPSLQGEPYLTVFSNIVSSC